jgi:carbamate kinase
MRIVIALGGNALLRRGEPLTEENQRRNIAVAVASLAPIARDNALVISHGNGPQVGLLALQSAAYGSTETYPLDVLDAETEGMVGYLIEQALGNLLPAGRRCASLLTQIEVDPTDPAFQHPSKPIGPLFGEDEARRLAKERGWQIARDGRHYRRVVPSPVPIRILELGVIKLLVDQGVIVICTGGGGIPTVRKADGGLVGVEAVIDKDLASSLLARELGADALLMLTDVNAVSTGWGEPGARAIRRILPAMIRRYLFDAGSMGPKVEAACAFVEQTGGIAGIGELKDAQAILAGRAGTLVVPGASEVSWWD